MSFTLETFGQRIKQQHPEYSDMSDREVGEKMLKKYPQYSDIVADHQGVRDFVKEKGPSTSLAKNFGKALPGAALQVGVSTPAKFVASVAETPKALITGKSSQNTYKVPGLKPFQSYQSDVVKRVQGGQSALKASLLTGADVGLGALETVGVAKGATKLPGLVGKFDARLGGAAVEKAVAKIQADSLQDALELVKPQNFSKKESINLLKTGQAEQKGLLRTIKPKTTLQDEEVAKSVQGLVSRDRNVIDNIGTVNAEVKRISEQEIRPFLKLNDKPFNTQTFQARLNEIQPPRMIKGDATLENTYNQVKKLMLDKVAANKKNNSGLWEARIAFDKEVEREFPTLFGTEKYTAVKQAVKDVRRAANDFIGSNTPDETFKSQLKRLSNMYTARDTIAENNYRLLESNILKRLAKRHPLLTKLLGYGLGTGIAGLGVKASLE